MSMISSLIDDLRAMADGQVTYRDARVVMLQAADTIWQLRDDLQRANAESANLRNLVADMLGYYAMPNNIDYKRESALLERARELGVEVDE